MEKEENIILFNCISVEIFSKVNISIFTKKKIKLKCHSYDIVPMINKLIVLGLIIHILFYDSMISIFNKV